MGKKSPYTTNTKIRGVLRQLFVRSRERAAALKRDGYTCQTCHRKQSTAKGREFKVEVHHKEGVLNWDKLFEAIRQYLLCHPDLLKTVCKECHKKEEAAGNAKPEHADIRQNEGSNNTARDANA